MATENCSAHSQFTRDHNDRRLSVLRARINELENEVNLLKLQLESRPHMRDYRVALQKIRKYEKILHKHNIDYQREKVRDDGRYSTLIKDIDFLPSVQSREFLKNICRELQVNDVCKAASAAASFRVDALTFHSYEKILEALTPKVSGVASLLALDSNGAPRPNSPLANQHSNAKPSGSARGSSLDRSDPPAHDSSGHSSATRSRCVLERDTLERDDAASVERASARFSHLAAALEAALTQLTALPDLREAVNELSVRLLPTPTPPTHTHSARSRESSVAGGAIPSLREVVERLERMRQECDRMCLLPATREQRERERAAATARHFRGPAAGTASGAGTGRRLSVRRDSGSSNDGAAATAHREHDSGRCSPKSTPRDREGGAGGGGGEHPQQCSVEYVRLQLALLLDTLSLPRDHADALVSRVHTLRNELDEARNVLRSLKSLLGLEEGTSGGRVVAAVSRLVDASEQQVHMQLRRALGDQNDLTALRARLSEYDAFFDEFHAMASALMALLGVSRLDLVVPSVRALRVIAGSTF